MSKAETDAHTAAAKGGATKANIVNLPVKAEPSKTEQVSRFVKDHPFMVLAGGLAIGALAAAFLPRRNREYVARRSSVMADAVGAASLAFAKQIMDRAEHLGDDVRRQSHSIADILVEKAGRLGDAAGDMKDRLSPAYKARPASLADHMAARATRLKDKFIH